MRRALERHDAIVTGAIAAHGGEIFQDAGDSFVAAFADASAALAAALTAQRCLFAAPWDEPGGPLRVRMALHTGPAERRQGQYRAHYTLNRPARLLAAGHGGQIFLPRETREELGTELGPGSELRDLGLHALRDLAAPLHVFQFLAPDLPADTPRLRSL